MEAPVFEFTLQDTVASAGADVLLKTIIAGTPCPEGNMSYFVINPQRRTFRKASWVMSFHLFHSSYLDKRQH